MGPISGGGADQGLLSLLSLLSDKEATAQKLRDLVEAEKAAKAAEAQATAAAIALKDAEAVLAKREREAEEKERQARATLAQAQRDLESLRRKQAEFEAREKEVSDGHVRNQAAMEARELALVERETASLVADSQARAKLDEQEQYIAAKLQRVEQREREAEAKFTEYSRKISDLRKMVA